MLTRNTLPLRTSVDRLFDSFFGAPATRDAAYPNLNVWETADGYHVEAELPGFSLDEIELTFQDDELSLKAEHVAETGEASEDVTWHCRERAQRTFRRTLRLPADVASEKATASFTNGVLAVFLPKAEATKPRRISVAQK